MPRPTRRGGSSRRTTTRSTGEAHLQASLSGQSVSRYGARSPVGFGGGVGQTAFQTAGKISWPNTKALRMGGSGSGRWGSRRPIAEGLQRFDLAEYTRRPDAVKPNASCIATIGNGKVSAQVRYTETRT